MTSLVKQIDTKIAHNPDLKSFVVLLTDTPDKSADALKAMAKASGLKNVPLTLADDPAGPSNYKLSPDADVTVLMWRNSEVKVNRAYAKGKLTEAQVPAIVADVAKILAE